MEEGTPLPDTLAQPLYINGPNVPNEEDAVETSPFEKFDPLLHAGLNASNDTGRRVTRSSRRAKKHEILSISFVKKYIQYTKGKMAPTLTQGAAEHIVQVYSNLRNEDMERNQRKVSRKRTLLSGRLNMLSFARLLR